jgi:hypothetical protein
LEGGDETKPMKDDDLQRRLAKLVALRDHPSTLPAIREEAKRAEERLRAQVRDEEPGPGRYQRMFVKHNQQTVEFERFLRDLDRETAKVVFPWHLNKPEEG